MVLHNRFREDDRLPSLLDHLDDCADPTFIFAAEYVVGFVQDDQLAAALLGTNELARPRESLQDCTPRRDLPDRLRIPALRSVHLDRAPPRLVRERERGARLPDAGVALEDDRAPIRPTLVPGC